jgi:hypothetical protein
VCLSVAFLFVPAAATAQFVLPTDTDLKSAYCITAIKKQLDLMNQILGAEPQGSPAYVYAQKMLLDRNSDLNRLQSYLVPKLLSLDATGLVLASKRAERDLEEAAVSTQRCTTHCASNSGSGTPDSKWSACLQTCSAEDSAVTRLGSCRSVNWLPF